MSEITLAMGMYAGIVLVLVGVTVLAKMTLIPSGEVTLRINQQREIAVPRGGKLLGALDANGIFVPSACGGAGTCGQCRAKVLGGGGYILPTERSLISRAEAQQGWRLTCQVPVKEDLEIEVPTDVLESRKWACRVRSNDNVATFIKELVLELPEGESMPFRAGGYVQTECPPHTIDYRDFDIAPEYRDDWDRYDMWRHVSTVDEPVSRAYSMANYPGEQGIIMLNVRIASPPPSAPRGTPPGKMSSYLFSLRQGDALTVSGPYGEFFAKETDAEMVFIGGGAGMAPMRSHIFDQLERLHTKRRISFWYGARNLKEAFYREDFDLLEKKYDNFTWHIALSEPRPEDEWTGPTGFIHQVVLDHYLSSHPAPDDIEYYLCGPPLMAHAVVAMLEELGVEPENILFDDFG
jgi:Na+-transporting NADH:ubiquinone oxidoreductase subunit F